MPSLEEMFPDKPAAPESPADTNKPSVAELFPDKKTDATDDAPKKSTKLSDVATAFGNAKSGGAAGVMETAEKAYDKYISQRDPKADYKTGLPFASKAAYLGQDSPKEKQKFLDVHYPGAKMTKDERGRDLIQFPNGKLIEPHGSGFWNNLAAEAVSHAPEMGGMVTGAGAGAAMGAPLGPYGAAAGGLGGAIIGGVGGKMGEEGLKSAGGIQSKTEKEYLASLNTAGQEGAKSEVGGKVADKVISKLVGGYPFGVPFLGKNQEINKQMTQRALDRGMVPPTSKSIPVATLLSQKQVYVEKVLGSSRDIQNVAAAKQGLADILKKSGMTDDSVENAVHSILRGESDVTALGKEASTYYKTLVDNLQNTANNLRKEASDALKDKFSKIDKAISDPKIDASHQVREDIVAAKDAFSEAASKQYGVVDELVGNKKLLSTQPMKEAVRKTIVNMPKDKAGNIIFPGEGGEALNRYVKNLLEQPELISFQQGQMIRSQLLHESYNGQLLKSLGDKNIGDLADAANQMFKRAEQGYIKSGGTGDEAKRAAKALADADKWYAENIVKFKDRDVAVLARDAAKTGAVRPEDVVKFVAEPKYASRMNKILPLLTPQTRQAVARADFDRMIDACTNLDGKIDSARLMKEIEKRSATAPILWGKQVAEDARIYAKRLAALNGDIELDTLTGDSSQIVGKLRLAAKTQEEVRSMLSNDETFLAALGKPGFLHDKAFDLLISPGAEHQTELAMKAFRGTPVEAKIKQAFIQKLMSNLASPKDFWQKLAGIAGEAGGSLNTAPMAKELSKYSDKQLTAILGKDLAGDLRTYAQDLDFVMGQHGSDIAASLAAGAARLGITLLDPFQWKRYAVLAFGEYILSRPGTLKVLTLGLKYPEGSPIRVGVENALKADLDNFLISHRKQIEAENKKSQ